MEKVVPRLHTTADDRSSTLSPELLDRSHVLGKQRSSLLVLLAWQILQRLNDVLEIVIWQNLQRLNATAMLTEPDKGRFDFVQNPLVLLPVKTRNSICDIFEVRIHVDVQPKWLRIDWLTD